MKRFLSILPLLALALTIAAQPANDDCGGIVNLGKAPICDQTVWDNTGATASMIGNDNLPVSPSCLGVGQPLHDVWFQFTAADTITDYRITVTSTGSPAMVNPLIILYRGDCQFDGLAEAGCMAPAPGATETVLDIVGLTPGLDYFIRISDYGGAAAEGKFTLCIKEIPPVVDITQGSTTLCKGKITDSGGTDNPYGPNEDFTFSICPTDKPACINFTLDWYNIEEGATTFVGDALAFYDGPNTGSPLIAQISGTPDFFAGDPQVTGGGGVNFQVQATSGCLTLEFQSDDVSEFEGFVGNWECSQVPCEKKDYIDVDPDITNAQIEAFVAEAATQVTITNIQCEYGAYGTFTAGDKTDLGLDKGLLLTSGSVQNAIGPNDSGSSSFSIGAPGDPDLDTLSKQFSGINFPASHDACVLELDVFVKGDQLTFDYVFGSEEYSEFVASNFNDIFTFLVSGPGIAGQPGLNGQENIAVLPYSATPVQIKSVNYQQNWQYYRNNELGQSVQYDGLTSDSLGKKLTLTARKYVTPCKTYHLKFAVADRGDTAYDSGVFIGNIKSGAPTVEVNFLSGVDYLSEYCFGQPDILNITLDTARTDTISYQVVLGGTALPSDYNLNIPAVLTFLPGETVKSFPINAILDTLVENKETLTISLVKDFGCGPVNLITTNIDIADQLIVEVTAGDTALVCAGGSLQLEATGATSYFWSPPGAVSNPNIADPTITPTQDIWLSVQGTAGTCTDEDSVYIHIVNPQINVQALAPTNICLGASVPLEATDNVNHSGLKWTPSAGLDDPTSATPIATPGETTTYTCSIEVAGCVVSQSVTINVDTLFFPKLTTLDTTVCQHYAVDLGEDIDPSTTNYDWSPAAGLSDPNASGPIALPQTPTTYVLMATSANGYCTESKTVKINVLAADVNINGDPYREICLGDSIQLFANQSGTGSIEWESSLGFESIKNPIWAGPDESAWYFVSFGTGQCIVYDSVYIRVDSLPDQTMSLEPFKSVYCPGEKVLIKSPTYDPASFPGLQPDMGNIKWYPNNSLLTPDTLWNLLFTTNDTITYTRVIKNYGCVDTSSITIDVFQPVDVKATVSDNYICPGELVQLNAVFSGIYLVEWDGPVSNKNIKDPTANPQGTTTFTVKMKGVPCPSSASVTVTVEPSPNIQINKDPIVCPGESIELQHNSDGAITWAWTLPNGTTSADPLLFLDPAVAGTYSVTATGPAPNNCVATETTTVTVPTATVSLGPDVEACGELQEVTLSANPSGTGGGSFVWSEGNPNGDKNTVLLGVDGEVKSYIVTYVFGNNCETYDTVNVKTLPRVYVNDFNIKPLPDSVLQLYCRGAKLTVVEKATSQLKPLTYNWSLNGQPLTSTTDSIQVNISNEGQNVIKVVVTNTAGCANEKQIGVNTRECFGIPNAFTPDGDGTNDYFELWYEEGAITIEGFKVYDRWGQVVYNDDEGTNHRWNGEINGHPAPMDVYVYKVTLRRPDQTREVISGDVTLIR